MPLRAALSLVLAGPGLTAPPAAPPASPPPSQVADNNALWDDLDAADPSLTTTPAPVERAIAVADLAEARLAEAALEDVGELLLLAGGARRIAYQRTQRPESAVHLCAMLQDAEQVLGRKNLPAAVAESAVKFQDEALAGLQSHSDAPCVAPPPSEPDEVRPEGPQRPPAMDDSPRPRRPVARVAAGSTVAVVGAGLLGGMLASIVGRWRANAAIAENHAAWAAEDRKPNPEESEAAAAANRRYERLGTAAVVLGIAGGVSLITGLAVALVPTRAASRARVRASGAGLVYSF